MDFFGVILTIILLLIIVAAADYISKRMDMGPDARRILMLVVGGLALLYILMMLFGNAPVVGVPRLGGA